MSKEEKKSGLSRRDFMKGLGVGVIGTWPLYHPSRNVPLKNPGRMDRSFVVLVKRKLY